MSERHRIGTFDSGGRFTVLLDVNDGSNLRVREFKVSPSEKQAIYPGATRRYGGSRKAGEVHGNGSLTVSWILRDSTADAVLDRWDGLVELLESARTDLFYEWRPGEASRSTYFELRGGLPADWDYVWWQFSREVLQLSAGFVIAPLAFGDPMDVLDSFGSDTLSDYTFDQNTSADVAVSGGVLIPQGTAAFTPATIGGMLMWHDASTLGLSDGTAVSSWTDASGNGRHAVQATGSKQPLYKTGIVNSQPAVLFDGTDDVLTTSLSNNDASVTLVLVAARSANNGVVRATSFGAGNAAIIDNFGSWGYFATAAGGIQDLGGSTASWTIIILRFDSAASCAAYRNGTLAATFDPNDIYQNASLTHVLGASDSTNEFWKGYIAERIVYDSALSDTNRDLLETYLGTKYNITVA